MPMQSSILQENGQREDDVEGGKGEGDLRSPESEVLDDPWE